MLPAKNTDWCILHIRNWQFVLYKKRPIEIPFFETHKKNLQQIWSVNKIRAQKFVCVKSVFYLPVYNVDFEATAAIIGLVK